MKNLLNKNINYLLFSKYEKSFFIENKIVPLWEDEVFMTIAVSKESNLNTLENRFEKLIKFYEVDILDINFVLNSINKKIELYQMAFDSIYSSSISENNIQKFFNLLIEYSIDLRTSDIHIEKYKEVILFRFRVDGRLKTFFTIEKSFFKMLSSYIKLISNLDITQTRLPMDSRFSIDIDNKKYDFRVSTMPTSDYESIVIRILDSKNISKSLPDLGFSSDIYIQLKNALKLTQGLILITGPTGSGKTTTLYSILKEINSDDKKIITIEDPIEYKIDSISQVAVNSKIGLSFELILKNILRQDPDIIFIGEIRDKLSLNIALQASLTGHLVIASIHANNSIETINRLFDLEADPFLVSVTLKYILAQRLVLSYCKKCKSKGCEKCNFTKFYDRSCIAELLKVDENISSLIFKKSDINEIKEYLKRTKFKTLLEDGVQKVKENKTSLDEVYKVVSN